MNSQEISRLPELPPCAAVCPAFREATMSFHDLNHERLAHLAQAEMFEQEALNAPTTQGANTATGKAYDKTVRSQEIGAIEQQSYDRVVDMAKYADPNCEQPDRATGLRGFLGAKVCADPIVVQLLRQRYHSKPTDQ